MHVRYASNSLRKADADWGVAPATGKNQRENASEMNQSRSTPSVNAAKMQRLGSAMMPIADG
jgi:hypothetical protein